MTGTHDTNVIRRIPAGRYSRRNPRTVAGVRIAVAIWLLVLAGIFWSRGHDWGVALLAPAALHLWLAGRRLARVQGQHYHAARPRAGSPAGAPPCGTGQSEAGAMT